MIKRKLWLKSGKGTYGTGNTQLTLSDLFDSDEVLNSIISTYTSQGIVFKNLSIFSDQFIKGGIELSNTSGTGHSIKVTALNTNNTQSAIKAINSSTTSGGDTAAIEAETTNINPALILRADKNIATGNVLEVKDSASGYAGDTNLSISKEGTITAKTIVKDGATAEDVLLGDGTTTPLSGIGGAGSTEGTFSVTLTDTGGGATYTTGFNSGKYVKIGTTIIIHLTVQGINTTGTPTGFLRMQGLPFTINGFAHVSVSDFHGQTQPYYNVTASVSPNPNNNILFGITSGATTSMGTANLQNVDFTNGRISLLIVHTTND